MLGSLQRPGHSSWAPNGDQLEGAQAEAEPGASPPPVSRQGPCPGDLSLLLPPDSHREKGTWQKQKAQIYHLSFRGVKASGICLGCLDKADERVLETGVGWVVGLGM